MQKVVAPVKITGNESWATLAPKFHYTQDGKRTLCGRTIPDNWESAEDEVVDCTRCSKRMAELSR